MLLRFAPLASRAARAPRALVLLAAVTVGLTGAAASACGGDDPAGRDPADGEGGPGGGGGGDGGPGSGPGGEGGTGPGSGTPACRPEDPFGAVTPVPGLDGVRIAGPSVTGDERTVFWFGSADGGPEDLYMATRADRSAPFGAPTVLGPQSSAGRDTDPFVSADGLRLYFDSDRTGVLAVFVATRASAGGAFEAPTLALQLPGNAIQPAYAGKTGTLYAATSLADGGLEIWRHDTRTDAGGPEHALHSQASDWQPTVSDDDQVMLFDRRAEFSVTNQAVRQADGGFGEPTPRLELPADAVPATLTPDYCRLYLLQAEKLVFVERAPR